MKLTVGEAKLLVPRGWRLNVLATVAFIVLGLGIMFYFFLIR